MKATKGALWKFIKLWWRMDTLLCVLLLIGIAGLIVSFVGFPKEIEEIVSACVYTESGETISCEVQVKGEVTTYLFRENVWYDISVYRDHILIVELEYDTEDGEYAYQQTYRSTGVKNVDRDALLVEMDVHTLFPGMEHQRCVLSIPAMNKNAAIEILMDEAVQQEWKQVFAWFTEE